MSNLSDLLPAGAGAKSATFTADGTLATGTTVALQSDGTVTEVAETTVATTTGSSTEFFTYSGTGVDSINYAYDTANDRLLLTYRSGGTAYYRVGTVSGTSISFGSEDTYISANAYDIRTVYDSTNARFVSCYTDFSNSAYGTAVVTYISNVGSGTVSGGTPVVFNSASTAWAKPVYDSANSKVVISYRDSGNTYGESVVGTVSGTSISFGSTATFESSSVLSVSSAYDANAGKVVVSYRNNGPGKSIVGTVSGTSISFGSSTQFFAAVDNVGTFTVYDPSTNKVAVGFCDSNASNQLKAIVGTVSGTSISFGSVTTVNTNDILPGDAVFDSNRNKVVFTYRDKGNSFYGTLNAGTISGTSITFDSNHVFASLNASNQGAAFDPDTNQVAIAYESGPGNTNLTSIGAVTTNSADFVGITDEAIANAATGSVVVEGGVITNSTLVPFSVSSVGTPVVFNAGNTNNGCAAYDSSNNKVVIAYTDSSNNSYGTAIVGTVSGTSISFGSEVVFSAANTNNIGISFDSSNNKVVIVYRDAAASNAVAIVGTVSGTSISFGSPTTYDSGSGVYNRVAYDSNAQKLVVVYSASSNSNYATAIVGTVSGTSISFGSSVVYESASSTYTDVAYDSDSQKVISTYRDAGNSNAGTGIVGTVSGTSISFGSPAVFTSGGATAGTVAYDATAQKVVVVYRDEANSYSGAANVGTVSGTSISFGATVNFTNSVGADYPEVEYDPSGGGVVVTYTDGGNGDIGKALFGTVSGTSISFTDAITYESSATYFTGSVYDANAQKMVGISKDGGNSNYGTAAVLTTSASLTTGSTYYVQDDGSLSTTSSSVTAGKALSSTTLLLKG